MLVCQCQTLPGPGELLIRQGSARFVEQCCEDFRLIRGPGATTQVYAHDPRYGFVRTVLRS